MLDIWYIYYIYVIYTFEPKPKTDRSITENPTLHLLRSNLLTPLLRLQTNLRIYRD